MTLSSLLSRTAAYNWSVDLVNQVAQGQGWSPETLALGISVLEQAKDGTPYLADPFWDLQSYTGPQYLATVVDLWKTSSTFPESWNKVRDVWVQALGYADSQEERRTEYKDLLNEALTETGESLQKFTIGTSISVGTITVIGLSIWAFTR